MRTLIVSSVFSCLLPAICLGQLGEPNCITSRIAEVPIEGGGTVCWYQYEQCNGTATSIIAGDCSAAVCRCMGSICACPDPSAFTPGPPAHFVDEAASPMAAVPAGDTWRTVSATQLRDCRPRVPGAAGPAWGRSGRGVYLVGRNAPGAGRFGGDSSVESLVIAALTRDGTRAAP